MLGGDRVRQRHSVIEAFYQDDRAEIVHEARAMSAAAGWRVEMHRALDLVGERCAIGDQIDCALTSCSACASRSAAIQPHCRCHRRLQDFRRAGGSCRCRLAEHQPLGGGDIGVAGADVWRPARWSRCPSQRRHCLRAADAVDLGDAAELGRRQHQGLSCRRRRTTITTRATPATLAGTAFISTRTDRRRCRRNVEATASIALQRQPSSTPAHR